MILHFFWGRVGVCTRSVYIYIEHTHTAIVNFKLRETDE